MQLVDRFGRIHNYLRISVTDACNLRCLYCIPSGTGNGVTPGKKMMSGDEIFRIAKIFTGLGIQKIRITGGEPLVRKDIAEILTALSTLGVKLAITTNGMLLHRFFDVLKRSAMDTINISLDSMNPETFRLMTKNGDADLILNNIRTALSMGFNVKINVVTLRGINDHMIPEFIGLTKDHPIDVRFIEFMPFSGNNWQKEQVFGMEEILGKVRAIKDITALPAEPGDTARLFSISGHKGRMGIITTITQPFCADCNRLRLTSDGKMRNCLFSNTEVDLLGPFREGKEIEELIFSSVAAKEKATGGIDLSTTVTNRTMISIGG